MSPDVPFDWREDPEPPAEPTTHLEVVQEKPFSKTSLFLWGLVIVSGLVLEAIGLRSTTDDWPPLTHVIVAYLPWAVTGGFIAWLKSHFSEAYGVDPNA
jgi:hypothetical protein